MGNLSMYGLLGVGKTIGVTGLRERIDRIRKTAKNHWSKPTSEPHTRLEIVHRDDMEGLAVKFHHTHVVKFWPDRIDIDNGGWNTTTTRLRINNALGYMYVPVLVRMARRGPNKGEMIAVPSSNWTELWEPIWDWYAPTVPHSFTWEGHAIDHKVSPEAVQEWVTFTKRSAASRRTAEIVKKLGFEPFGARAKGLPKTLAEAEELNRLAQACGFIDFAAAFQDAGLDMRDVSEGDLEMLRAGLLDLMIDKQRSH